VKNLPPGAAAGASGDRLSRRDPAHRRRETLLACGLLGRQYLQLVEREAMASRSRDNRGRRRPTVTIRFRDSEVSFRLPAEATYQDLAERLARVARPHGGLESASAVSLR
jgi:hypothetical protein